MKLQNITPLAFNKLCDKPLYIDRTVSKEVVKTIADHFMVNGIFIEEVKLTEEERMNLNNITLAFKNYIEANNIHAGVHRRQERIFLRNDEIPIAFVAAYPRAIVNASKRNRLKFETEKKV